MDQKQARLDYKEPNYFQEDVELYFNLHEDYCDVLCRTNLRQRVSGSSELFLDGKELELLEIKLDEKVLSPDQYQTTTEGLQLNGLQNKHQLEIKTRIFPAKNKSLSGLYKTSDFYCTQNEAEGFRRITYFLDRPDNLAGYICHIEADKNKYPVLLSNGDCINKKDLEAGRHLVSWRDPFNKPCYLFALVAGDLGKIQSSYKTKSGKNVNLEIYAEEKYLGRLDFAMTALKDSMKWDEDRFGLEYDLGTYMIVVSDDFNSGAMENKGLNIFNSKFVLASPETATEDNYYMIQSVIGHEYFHNYSGNRVTCRDWFQLSLKEGFTVFRDQEFTSDLNSRPVKRIEDVKSLRQLQFPEDAGPNSHPVRPDYVQSIDNFYSATIYEKGAELIRMLHTLIGEEKFQQGSKAYFEKYDGMAVTCEDFVASMEEASGLDLSQFRLWYSQSGTPTVEVTKSWDSTSKTLTLSFTQNTPATNDQKEKNNLMIPCRLGFINKKGETASPMQLPPELTKMDAGDFLFVLTQKNQDLKIEFDEEIIPSLFRSFSAPIYLKSNLNGKERALLAESDRDAFNRAEALEGILESHLMSIYEGKPVDASALSLLNSFLMDYEKDPSFTDLALTAPDLGYLILKKDQWDFDRLQSSHQKLKQQMAEAMSENLESIYLRLSRKTENKTGLKYKGEKSLQNKLLSYLQIGAEDKAIPYAKEQYKKSKDMTNTMGALSVLRQSQNFKPCENAFVDFKTKWREDRLVINNYIRLVAAGASHCKQEFLEELLKEDFFTMTNPNNLYSLFAAFGRNLLAFHWNYEWSYDFLWKNIVEIDSFNPQVAARIASNIESWTRLGESRVSKMKQVLEETKKQKLSKNLDEIVNNNLRLLVK